jgi:predicted Zn-dependent protease
VKLFSKLPTTALSMRTLPVAVLILWGLAGATANAQAPAPAPAAAPIDAAAPVASAPLAASAPVAASATLSLDGSPKDIPDVALTSQILFQVLAAEISLQRGQLAPAYQTYLSLTRDTHDPRMAERAAQIALQAQSPSDALVAARLWYQYAPDSERAEQLTASMLVLNGNLSEAQPILERELASIPDAKRGGAIISLQQLISQGPDRIGDLQLLQALLKNDMQRPEAWVAIARQQLLTSDPHDAQASLEQALKLKPDDEQAALMLAQLGAGNRTEAIANLNAFVDKNPNARAVRIALAQLYLQDNQLDAARAQFDAMRKLNGTDPMPVLALAMLDIQQEHLNAAKRNLEQYAQMLEKQGNADPGQAYLYLADLAADQNNDREAQQWLAKISPDSPQYLPGQVTRAQLLAKENQLGDARALLASLNPTNPNDQLLVMHTDAGLLFDAKQYQEAQSRYAQVNEQFPNVPSVLYDYAMACEKNHQYDLMETLLRQLIKLEPGNANAYNALGYSLADRNQDLDEADKLIEKASALAPSDAFIMDSLGWVKFREGDKQAALTLLRRAYDLKPNAEIGAHLGEVLWTLGQQDEAKQTWRAAFKLEKDNDTLIETVKRLQVGNL